MKFPAPCILFALLPSLGLALPAACGAGGATERDQIAAFVDRTYEPALRALHLPDETLERAKQLLVERSVARAIATRTMPGGRTVEEQKAAIDQAEREVDQKLQAMVEPTVYQKIQEMVFVELELDNIEIDYAPAMAAAGVPLDGPQAVALAKVFKAVYIDVDAALSEGTDFAAIRAAKTPAEKARAEAPLVNVRAYHTRDVDSNSLSVADREAMRQAAVFLSQGQLVVLQKKLAALTRGWLRLEAERRTRSGTTP